MHRADTGAVPDPPLLGESLGTLAKQVCQCPQYFRMSRLESRAQGRKHDKHRVRYSQCSCLSGRCRNRTLSGDYR